MTSESEKIIGIYERHAHEWANDRGRGLFEKPWLDRFLALLPPKASVLDIGCGCAEPIARSFIECGHEVTGVSMWFHIVSRTRPAVATRSGSRSRVDCGGRARLISRSV